MTAVWYPACCSSLGMVSCEPSKRERLSINPFLCECSPVNKVALAGPQMELPTKERLNSIPSLARRSILGVLISVLLYALIALASWSSLMIYRIFGRCWDSASKGSSVNRASNCFMGLGW